VAASLYLDLVMEQYHLILVVVNIVISPIQPSYTYIFMLSNINDRILRVKIAMDGMCKYGPLNSRGIVLLIIYR